MVKVAKNHPDLTHAEEQILALGAVGLDVQGVYEHLSSHFEKQSSISIKDTAKHLPPWMFKHATSNEMANWAAQEFHAIANWWHHGKVVYRVSAELTKMLMATDIRIPFDMFHLPFPAFYVEFENTTFEIGNSDGTLDKYLGSYVWNGRIEQEVHKHSTGANGDEAIFMYHVSRHRSDKPMMVQGPDGPVRVPETSNIIRSWYRYADLEEMGFSSETFGSLLKRELDARSMEAAENTIEDWSKVERLISALIVYLTMPDAIQEARDPKPAVAKVMRSVRDVKNPGKRRKLVKRLGRMSAQKFIYLPYMHAEGEEKPEGGKWKLNRRVPVTGHFKSQAYGKDRAFRKTIWIKPYWKGPEGAELGSTPRKVR